MKKIGTIILIFMASCAFGQDSLKTFSTNRKDITTTGMEVLGTWAAGNIAVGAIELGKPGQTSADRNFYRMNVIWNFGNLGAALFGYTGTLIDQNNALTPEAVFKAQKKVETTFLINASLDVVYIGVGFYLHHRGNTENSPELHGYGKSIVLQAAFLLLFDGTMYTTEKRNGNKLYRFLKRNPMTFDGKRIGMVINMR